MSVPGGATGAVAGEQDAERWREAARLRGQHSGWVIIWLAPAAEFRAYRRLPGTRHDTTVAAATADDLATAVSQAEQDAPRARSRSRRGQARP
jgi:hypothetical protein